MSIWTEADHAAILAAGEIGDWEGIAAALSRPVNTCKNRFYTLKRFKARRGYYPSPGELRRHPSPVAWEWWEDEYVRLSLRKRRGSAAARAAAHAINAVAGTHRRSVEAVRWRILWLDFDPEEVQDSEIYEN